MRDNKAIMVTAALAIAGSGAAIYLLTHAGFGPGLDTKRHQAAGWGMAQQVLALVKPGADILVITRDTSTLKNPASDVQLAAFKKALAKGGARIRSNHAMQLDPLRPVQVPPGDFLHLIRNAPNGSLIASFMGPPLLTPEQRQQVREIKPSIVAFCTGSMSDPAELRWLFDQGLLQVAVVDKPDALRASGSGGGLREYFDRFYLALTPANHGSLPPSASSP